MCKNWHDQLKIHVFVVEIYITYLKDLFRIDLSCKHSDLALFVRVQSFDIENSMPAEATKVETNVRMFKFQSKSISLHQTAASS